MSLENDDLLDQPTRTSIGSPRKLRISYTRHFLLSLSELDECKRLPNGFDQSLLSEFDDAPQERFRSSGSLSSHSFGHNKYGSSPPTRGDTNNYSRNTHRRWDSRSSGRSDQDGDSQSDLDSDPGRHYLNQSRRPWQVPDHDGLLGSGSFPRPDGYAAGTTAPKFRAGDQYQLNRSNEPYHPPRRYKAMPHSRRETNDSYNDETFGSSECTSEDRVEEERKRRASFELMRMEQQKDFQEKQKLGLEKHKDDFDITFLLEDIEDDNGALKPSTVPSELVVIPVSSSDSNKSYFPTPAPASRPLVPPGFSSTVGEKNVGTKSTTQRLMTEVSDELGGSSISSYLEEKQSSEKVDLVERLLRSPGVQDSVNRKNENNLNFCGVSNGDILPTSKRSEAFEALVNSKSVEPDTTSIVMNRIVGEPIPAQSTSILEKLFSSALAVNSGGSSSVIENQNVKVDDLGSPQTVQSSRFAQWFPEEEKKPVHDLPSDRPSDLLSLIVGGEKVSFQDLGVKTLDHLPPNLLFQSSEDADDKIKQSFAEYIVQDTEPLQNGDKPKSVATVLTCEDLEQSILSEVSGNPSAMPPAVQFWSQPDARYGQQKADVDNEASQHLLSLLQKGTGPKDTAFSPILDFSHSIKPEAKSLRVDAEQNLSTGKSLTLETLFGAAFMKELQPAGAPNADHRGSGGPAKVDVADAHGSPFSSMMGDNTFSSAVGDHSTTSNHGTGGLSLNWLQLLKPEKIEEHALSFSRADPLQFPTELGSNPAALDGSVDIHLPEEDSLISVGGPVNSHELIPARNLPRSELLPSQGDDITGRLTALNMLFRKERHIVGSEEGPIFPHGHDMRESDVHHRNVHVQPPSLLLHRQQLNHLEMFPQLDSRPSNFVSHMNMMASENTSLQDAPNYQFPLNMIQSTANHPGNGMGRYDPTTYSPILQQMQMPSNFPPSHHLHGFPRGLPLPAPSSDQAAGFRQDASTMQGFPLGERILNVDMGGAGYSLQGPVVGGGANHPEALQRLIETELRSNPKQLPPSVVAGREQGMYSHELDTGFRYR